MEVNVIALGNGKSTLDKLLGDYLEVGSIREIVLAYVVEVEIGGNKRMSGIGRGEGSLAGTLAYYVVVARGVSVCLLADVLNGGVTLKVGNNVVGEVGVTVVVSVNVNVNLCVVYNEILVNGEENVCLVELNLNKGGTACGDDVDVVAYEGEGVFAGLCVVALLEALGLAVGCGCSAVESVDKISKSAGVVGVGGKNAAGYVVIAAEILHSARTGLNLVAAVYLAYRKYGILANLLVPVLVAANVRAVLEGLVEYVGVAVTENEVNFVGKSNLYEELTLAVSAVNGLVSNDARINNLVVAGNSRAENREDVGLVNFANLLVTYGAVARSVDVVRFLVGNLYRVLTESCVPVVVLVVGPLVVVNVLVDILDDVVTNVALAVAVCILVICVINA